jgi:hypothetical protein
MRPRILQGNQILTILGNLTHKNMSAVKSFLAFVSLLCSFSPAFAQSAQVGTNVHDHLLIKEARRAQGEIVLKKFEGSPYLNDELLSATVSTEKLKFIPVPMRYNIADDEMEYLVEGLRYLLDPDPKIKRIAIGKDVFVVARERRYGFYQLKLEGDVSVVAKLVVNLRPQNDLMGIPAKYSRQPDTYYVMLKDGTVNKVSNVKNFLALLPDKKNEVGRYAKDENLSAGNYNGLIALVTYYNSLVAAN